VKESAKTLLLRAIRVGDEHNPPVKPRGHHLDTGLLTELADRCHEYALAHAADGESADWLIFHEGFAPWWREMLGKMADRVLPGLRTDIVRYLEDQGLAKRADPHDTRLSVRPRSPVARTPDKKPVYWWECDASENVWMEITRRDDIGTDLKAPSVARGGVATASYVLVPLVRPGDVVVHYDSRQEAIVGASVAASGAEPAPIYWVARGGYARRAGEQPRWLPGLRVALNRYRQLEPPVALAEIRRHKDALLSLRRRIQAQASGQPIYFPWIPYQDTLRTFQSYLVKMPREALRLFPQLDAMVDQAKGQASELLLASPTEQAEDALKDAAGKVARRGRGQGFQLDQQVKVAVEALAMNVATEFYSNDWVVEDVHGTESYDLICRHGDEVKHVEVKGTTTDGAGVILTPNEVRHAREHLYTALFVVSNITVEPAEDGTVIATGGKRHLYDPWHLDDGTLTPLGFRYQVPVISAEDT
jgi:uncharacterized protein DUF3883